LAAARDLGVLDLVLMGDSALRLGHFTIDELVATAAQRRRGAPRLGQAAPVLSAIGGHSGNCRQIAPPQQM